MGNLIPKALEESFRILKRNCNLINATIIIEKNSEGYKALKNFFSEQCSEGFEKFLLANQVGKFHKDAGFKEAEFKIIGESIGKKMN